MTTIDEQIDSINLLFKMYGIYLEDQWGKGYKARKRWRGTGVGDHEINIERRYIAKYCGPYVNVILNQGLYCDVMKTVQRVISYHQRKL